MWRVLRFLPLVLVLALATTVAYADHIPVVVSGSGMPLVVGDGLTSWSSELWSVSDVPFDDTVGPGVATLEAAVGDGSSGIAGAIYLVDEPFPVYNLYAFYSVFNTVEGDTWDPIVGVLVDVDGDGYEADPAAWQLGGFDPELLGDDSFVQCENPEGLGAPLSGNNWGIDYLVGLYLCYTPNEAGTGYDSFYVPWWHFMFFDIGRIEPDDMVVGFFAWVGGSSNFDGQTTLFDNLYYILFSELIENWEEGVPFHVLPLDPPVGVEFNRFHPKVVDSLWAPDGQDGVDVIVYSANHWGDQFEFRETTHEGGGVAFLGAPDGDYYTIFRWCRDGELRSYRYDFSFGGAVDIVAPLIDLSEVDSEVVGTC